MSRFVRRRGAWIRGVGTTDPVGYRPNLPSDPVEDEHGVGRRGQKVILSQSVRKNAITVIMTTLD